MSNKGVLLMLLCCLIPIGLLGMAVLLRVPLGTVLTVALVLACPIMMLGMMAFMRHNQSAIAEGEHGDSHRR